MNGCCEVIKLLRPSASSDRLRRKFLSVTLAVLPGLATTPGLSIPDVCGSGSTLIDSSTNSDGSEVSLVRYSSSCQKTSTSLDSVVQDGLVFPAEEVQTLESPCADGPNPAIDLHFFIESHSVLLDFSKVVERGRFPSAEFDGYVLEVLLEESNGTLMSVEIDRDATNLPLSSEDVEWDRSHIDLNFEGVGYDEHSLLKLDLTFARVTPPM